MSLEKLLYEGKGKQTQLRILNANGAAKASGNDNGKFKDLDLDSTNFWTVSTVFESDGTEIGQGNGIMLAQDGQIVNYTTSFTGKPKNSGRSIRGSLSFQTDSQGTVSSLDDMVAVLEFDSDAAQNYSLKLWEWK
jgi:hypothetical protein